ncbi:cobalamin biosynthesis protein [Actinacidiphila sp. ITFR-21]|uniref:cobalamin biosynthesis protein n=1 Tax=Actinacidiphila sp. ITFR-21 TaxID=3075199 RepID=UPI00288B45E5|nr:cobalamin biosynthesis protein [Streptomyces sp. ITFR-21]WNI14970.1 cobalamin biosynthesis protein [Streptomyces sp. ITFR-21]
MRTDRVFAYGATLGFLADLVAGDPRRGHPVAGFGRLAGALERRMWRDDRGSGAVYAALCAGGAVTAAVLAGRAVRPSAALSAGLAAAATWSALGGTSLAREARAVGAALEAGDLAAARARLPHLCGRDPQALDAAGIARAVVESVAENTSDAVVGALVWGALGGVPGVVGFRAANTLDAMVGHRSPRFLRFGWAAARLDDVLGYPGARLTACLAVLASGHPRSAARTWRRDAAAHPSPNAGPVEAAFAGALRLRLGGTLSYAGRTEHRPLLGAQYPPPSAADIPRAIRLSRRVGALALAVSVAASAAGVRSPRRRGAGRPGAVAAGGTRAGAVAAGGTGAAAAAGRAAAGPRPAGRRAAR